MGGGKTPKDKKGKTTPYIQSRGKQNKQGNPV